MYEFITDGFRTYGPARALAGHTNPDGTLTVTFDAYYYDDKTTHYEVGDGSQYSMSEAELNKLLGVAGPNARGYAVLAYDRGEDFSNFRVLTYDVEIQDVRP